MGYLERRRRQRRIRLLVPLAVLIIAGALLLRWGLRDKRTGLSWLKDQEYYIAGMTELAYSTDEIILHRGRGLPQPYQRIRSRARPYEGGI